MCTKARSYLKKRIKKTAVTKKVPRFFLLYSCSKDSFLSHILLLFGKADPGQALRKYKETLPEWVGQERVTVYEKARKWEENLYNGDDSSLWSAEADTLCGDF